MSKSNDEDIDDMIDEWHENIDIDCQLHTYLGMSWEEYRDWVGSPKTNTTTEQKGWYVQYRYRFNESRLHVLYA